MAGNQKRYGMPSCPVDMGKKGSGKLVVNNAEVTPAVNGGTGQGKNGGTMAPGTGKSPKMPPMQRRSGKK